SAALRVDDHLALVEEVIGDADGGIEQTARILAKVEDELLHPLPFQLLDRFVELANGRGGEVFDADVADAGLQHQHVGNRVGGDRGAYDRKRDRVLHPWADDLDVDRRSFRPFEALDDVVEREGVGRTAFDFGDDV